MSTVLGSAMLVSCTLAFPVHEKPADAAGPSDGGSLSPEKESSSLRYRAEVMADAPLLYLRLGDKEGPTAKDEAGGTHGSYPAGGVTYGAPGALAADPDAAIAFDGTAGITMPPGVDFSGAEPFTIEVWANQTAYNGYGFVLDHGDYTRNRAGWDLLSNADEVVLERWDGSNGSAEVVATSPLTLGVYHHLVVTFDGTDLRLYIDAELLATSPGTTRLPRTGTTWSVGRQNCDCSPNHFRGTLDELAIYPKVLSQGRISAHYRAAGR